MLPRCYYRWGWQTGNIIADEDDVIFEHDICNPINSLGTSAPFVFVIDALDEWPQRRIFLEVLDRFKMYGSLIRFIFTSRFQEIIKIALRPLSPYEVDMPKATTDVMKSYFQDRFSRMQPRLNVAPCDVDSLVNQAQGLFIWAATVCGLVEQSEGEATAEALKTIIASPEEATFPQSTILYLQGLLGLCRDKNQDPQALRKILSIMATMQWRLSVETFSSFANVKESDVQLFHKRLRAFYHAPCDAGIIYPLHLVTYSSFNTFLFAGENNSGNWVWQVVRPLIWNVDRSQRILTAPTTQPNLSLVTRLQWSERACRKDDKTTYTLGSCQCMWDTWLVAYKQSRFLIRNLRCSKSSGAAKTNAEVEKGAFDRRL